MTEVIELHKMKNLRCLLPDVQGYPHSLSKASFVRFNAASLLKVDSSVTISEQSCSITAGLLDGRGVKSHIGRRNALFITLARVFGVGSS